MKRRTSRKKKKKDKMSRKKTKMEKKNKKEMNRIIPTKTMNMRKEMK